MKLSEHAKKILIPLHVLWALTALWFAAYGTWSTSATVVTVLWWTALSGMGIAVGFHRYFSHKSFRAHKVGRWLMLALGSLAGQGSPVFWVALHNGYHHPHSDTSRDLHSPVHGLWNAYMGWILRLRPDQVSLRAATSLIKDPIVKYVHAHYNRGFWLCYTVICGLAATSGSQYVLAILTGVLWAIHQECVVNVVNHTKSLGYAPFDTEDNSVNNVFTGYLCWGQGWHNNHHAYPGFSNFGLRWFEFDPTRILIPLVRQRNPSN